MCVVSRHVWNHKQTSPCYLVVNPRAGGVVWHIIYINEVCKFSTWCLKVMDHTETTQLLGIVQASHYVTLVYEAYLLLSSLITHVQHKRTRPQNGHPCVMLWLISACFCIRLWITVCVASSYGMLVTLYYLALQHTLGLSIGYRRKKARS